MFTETQVAAIGTVLLAIGAYGLGYQHAALKPPAWCVYAILLGGLGFVGLLSLVTYPD